MLRIIIALLIAIFIFNSSQETTINYNEIIKNQKMFLVKNIRGVLPTLSGNLKEIQSNLFYLLKKVGKLFISKITIQTNQKFLTITHWHSINLYLLLKILTVSLMFHMSGKITRIISTLKKSYKVLKSLKKQFNK